MVAAASWAVEAAPAIGATPALPLQESALAAAAPAACEVCVALAAAWRMTAGFICSNIAAMHSRFVLLRTQPIWAHIVRSTSSERVFNKSIVSVSPKTPCDPCVTGTAGGGMRLFLAGADGPPSPAAVWSEGAAGVLPAGFLDGRPHFEAFGIPSSGSSLFASASQR